MGPWAVKRTHSYRTKVKSTSAELLSESWRRPEAFVFPFHLYTRNQSSQIQRFLVGELRRIYFRIVSPPLFIKEFFVFTCAYVFLFVRASVYFERELCWNRSDSFRKGEIFVGFIVRICRFVYALIFLKSHVEIHAFLVCIQKLKFILV